jgi:hypothetical protein
MPSPTIAVTPSPTPVPSVTPAATFTPSPTPTRAPPPRVITSDDGQLTITFSDGAALPEGVVLTASARGRPDLPPELVGLQVRSAFYELEPSDVTFVGAALVQRSVTFRALELDVAEDGLPLLALALRTPDGEWSWLADQTLTTDGRDIQVSGRLTQTGTLFAFGGTAFVQYSPLDTALEADVGSSALMSAALSFPEDAEDPPILLEPAVILGSDIVEIGAATGPGGGEMSQEFVCASEGLAAIGLTLPIENVGAESALFNQLGLGPVSTEVALTAALTCTNPTLSASSASPPP